MRQVNGRQNHDKQYPQQQQRHENLEKGPNREHVDIKDSKWGVLVGRVWKVLRRTSAELTVLIFILILCLS